MKAIVQLFALVIWMAGVVIASGFWSTFFALVFPLWAWYLVVERMLVVGGII